MLQPVALERGPDGRVVRELPGETLTVYNAAAAAEAIAEFEQRLATLNEEADDEPED